MRQAAIGLVLALSCTMAGCDTASDVPAAPPDAPMNNAAEPVDAAGPAPSPASYADLKRAAEMSAEPIATPPGKLLFAGDPETDDAPYFDVVDCNEEFASVDLGDVPADIRSRELLARRVVRLKQVLAHIGLRPKVFAAPLQLYEQRMIAFLDGESGQPPDVSAMPYPPEPQDFTDPAGRNHLELWQLARQIEANRQRLQPDAPRIAAEGGCGAGEGDFRIRTQPEAGRVWLITRFAFNLCRARRIDPWNRDRCHRWTEVAADMAVPLSGSYMYQARWPDGGSGRGSRSFDGVAAALAAADDKPPPTITIRPD
jgi:hypothetical protein